MAKLDKALLAVGVTNFKVIAPTWETVKKFIIRDIINTNIPHME